MDKQKVNALLAEHLRGWTRQARQVAGETVTVWKDPDAKGMQKQEYQAHELPDLAGTWAGMGIIVAKMWEKKFFFEMRRNKEEFTATFTSERCDEFGIGHDKEAPVAAGVAALRALNVEVE